VSVLSLAEVRVEPDGAALASAGLSRPAAGETVGAASFVVRGWALGEGVRALAVEMRAAGRLVRVAPVREATPDIAHAFPDRSAAVHCGFLTRVEARALRDATELQLTVVLADGGRTGLATIGLAHSEPAPRAPRDPKPPPSVRPDVQQLALAEARRRGVTETGLLERVDIPALDGVALEGRTVLDLSGGPGHVARAARARGAALVDSVHEDELADLARLLDLYHGTARVFVHESLAELKRTYDVVVLVGREPGTAVGQLESLGAEVVVRS
jgi:hypothetical protein